MTVNTKQRSLKYQRFRVATRTRPLGPLPPEAVSRAGAEVTAPGVSSLAAARPAPELTVLCHKPPMSMSIIKFVNKL